MRTDTSTAVRQIRRSSAHAFDVAREDYSVNSQSELLGHGEQLMYFHGTTAALMPRISATGISNLDRNRARVVEIPTRDRPVSERRYIRTGGA